MNLMGTNNLEIPPSKAGDTPLERLGISTGFTTDDGSLHHSSDNTTFSLSP